MAKTIKGYSVEMINELESLHSEGSSSSCQYCWKPVVGNKCTSCKTENNLESDPFLNLTEEYIY
jgi:hypothetical protein